MNMFSAEGHCLFSRNELPDRFFGWEILHNAYQEFAAPEQKTKVFSTVIARKPCSHRSA
jgi:hypothetical protein